MRSLSDCIIPCNFSRSPPSVVSLSVVVSNDASLLGCGTTTALSTALLCNAATSSTHCASSAGSAVLSACNHAWARPFVLPMSASMLATSCLFSALIRAFSLASRSTSSLSTIPMWSGCLVRASSARSSMISQRIFASTSALLSWLITALFLMLRALFAYLSVLRVSGSLMSAGDMHAIISVRLLPPRESCNSLVSFESLYGTWPPLLASSPRALMTLPRASSPELIAMPSLARSPVAPVFLSLSDPARSTKWNFEVRKLSPEPPPVLLLPSSPSVFRWKGFLWSRVRVKMACEREDVWFMFVLAVVRARDPLCRHPSTSSSHVTASSVSPAI
eukprot:comp22602_c0_seq1/m.34666 comp22602_c0_seq1/g.34666  ORF comp22602_c0_seq1/g.34666 comp22602_c0_seq1/m.34666 type:complete len:333 (+) comp22602_c0_seq1:1550-2548(+)